MDKKSNNPDNLKNYTNELRDLIDSYETLSQNQLSKLKKSYNLSEEDQEIILNFIDKKISEASNFYDYGEWEKATNSIEEANYKDPFNKETLLLYYKILMEKTSLLGERSDEKKLLPILLKRISMVDKNLHTRLVKDLKSKKESKISKLWLLLLLVLIIPLAILFRPKKSTPIEYGSNKNVNISYLGVREIDVNYEALRHESKLEIEVVNSVIDGTSSNFFYSLDFYLSSKEQNILSVEGEILWLDADSNIIYRDIFKSKEGEEYYLKENIPISYIKTSHRLSPNLYSIVIKVNDIISGQGKERTLIKEVPVLFNSSNTFSITIDETSFEITTGVTSKYLGLGLIITNKFNKSITILKGSIEWVDEFGRIKNSEAITLISKSDVPLEPGGSRSIFRVLELDNSITNDYRINISEGL